MATEPIPRWTDREDAKLKRYVRLGYSDAAIAGIMNGRSRGAVKHRRLVLGLLIRKGSKQCRPGTDELGTIRQMAADGYSAGQIGESVGRTKNSVIGICKRNGIALRGRCGRPATGTRRPTATAPTPTVKPAPEPQPQPEPVTPETKTQPPLRLPLVSVEALDGEPPGGGTYRPRHYRVNGLRHTQCRYPVTDDAPHRFCGLPVIGESSYCEAHHAICCHRKLKPLKGLPP